MIGILAHLHAGLSPDEAADRAIRFFAERVPGEAGCIVHDREGRIGFAPPIIADASAGQTLSAHHLILHTLVHGERFERHERKPARAPEETEAEAPAKPV